MRRATLPLFTVVAALLLAGASCPSRSPVVSPDLLAINDPTKAEDAFFTVAQRVRDRSGHVDTQLVEQFRESARDTWRGLEKWRGTGDATDYRAAWPFMVQNALLIEAAARGK